MIFPSRASQRLLRQQCDNGNSLLGYANVSAYTRAFSHFDKEERNEKALRKKIEALLQKSDSEQLQKVPRLLKALLEP
jgi:hypothetical protein